jgi:AraC-like DNA-binding protein
VEPYSVIGLELADRFQPEESCVVFEKPAASNAFFQTSTDSLDVGNVLEALLARIPTAAYDERVAKIVDYITENYFQADITPQTFADIVFLSPSRLASLFKQQTGSSLSKYLLWTRLRQAIYLILSDESRTLTDVAYDTGFYDLPQFNKYMYEMFGMPPKALKHNSDLIRIY